jgi:hypothetical protein
LVGAWVDVVGDGSNAKGKEKDKGTIEQDVVALLKLFDLAESNVVEDALLSVFKGRVDIFDALEFGGQCLLVFTSIYNLTCSRRRVLGGFDTRTCIPGARLCRALYRH